MIRILKVCGYGWFADEPDEFWIPVKISAESQRKMGVDRNDRRLPVGHRCRGDVA